MVAKDAHIGGDLELDGTLKVHDLFIPGSLKIDGGEDVGGVLHAAALSVDTGAILRGGLTVFGQTSMSGTLLMGTGSVIDASDLFVRGALQVVGDVTIKGLATFLGNVEVKGELIVSNRQAGFAVIPQTESAVTITFTPAMSATPVTTITPQGRVGSEWWIDSESASGFTIRIAQRAGWPVKFSWISVGTRLSGSGALSGTGETATQAIRTGATPFPVDDKGVPLSTNAAWNACIRNQAVMNGQPLDCSRYHSGYVWDHPDIHISFTWNDSVSPPILQTPDGYEPNVTTVNVDPQTQVVASSSSSVSSSASDQQSATSSQPQASSENSSSSSISSISSTSSSSDSSASSVSSDSSSTSSISSSSSSETSITASSSSAPALTADVTPAPSAPAAASPSPDLGAGGGGGGGGGGF